MALSGHTPVEGATQFISRGHFLKLHYTEDIR